MRQALWRARHFLADRLWVRPAVASLSAALLALAAVRVDIESPQSLPFDISKATLVTLLSMIATSMLSVATFSVAAIVTATTAISQATTPRVTRLILSDSTMQNVLASFISAFIFSIVAIFAVEALPYGPAGRVMVFLGLVAMILWVLVSFLRWVDHITHLGRVGTAMERTESAALAAFRPETVGTFGAAVGDGRAAHEGLAEGLAVRASAVGYVLSIDVGALDAIADRLEASIVLAVRPGDAVDTVRPMAWICPRDGVLSATDDARLRRQDSEANGGVTPDDAADVCDAIQIASTRDTQNDPRFGVIILAETAAKALSPGVNDPGTAIGILSATLRVFTRFAQIRRDGEPETAYPRVSMPPLSVAGLADDAFTAIARDGAGTIEVGIRLQKTLQGLARLGDPELAREARRIGNLALELAEAEPLAKSQKARLAAEVGRIAEDGAATRIAARSAGRVTERRAQVPSGHEQA